MQGYMQVPLCPRGPRECPWGGTFLIIYHEPVTIKNAPLVPEFLHQSTSSADVAPSAYGSFTCLFKDSLSGELGIIDEARCR